jgi:hypothetical protein
MRTKRSARTQQEEQTMKREINFYALTFGLRGTLRAACMDFTRCDEFEQTARSYARFWRETLRPQLRDSVECRRNLFLHLLREFLGHGLDSMDKYRLALALSLAMTDRTQQLVDRWDGRWRMLYGRN